MCNSGYFLSYVDGLGTSTGYVTPWSYARSFLSSTNARFYKEQDAAQAFTPLAKKKNGTSGHLCITAQAGET